MTEFDPAIRKNKNFRIFLSVNEVQILDEVALKGIASWGLRQIIAHQANMQRADKLGLEVADGSLRDSYLPLHGTFWLRSEKLVMEDLAQFR